MQKADNDVSHLDAGVVDVVLDLDYVARGFQDSHERVAQDGIADVTDVGSFVGVDTRVLDHLLRSISLLMVLEISPPQIARGVSRDRKRR
jgi:hypothetical protein